MLVIGGHGKIGEDQQKDEEVVYAERLLNQVAGQEFERGIRTLPEVYPQVEEQRQGDPESGPHERFFDADNVSLTMKNPQIEDQEHKYNNIKADPHSYLAGHQNSILFSTRKASAEPATTIYDCGLREE